MRKLSPKPPIGSSSSMFPKTPKGLFPPKKALKISSASAKETPVAKGSSDAAQPKGLC